MILVGMALAACAVPIAHAGTIYRCIEGGGGVLYSDAPCPGGRLVPVPEGNVDPHARERLQRDLDAFDRRQSLRNAESARAGGGSATAARAGSPARVRGRRASGGTRLPLRLRLPGVLRQAAAAAATAAGTRAASRSLYPAALIGRHR